MRVSLSRSDNMGAGFYRAMHSADYARCLSVRLTVCLVSVRLTPVLCRNR